MLLTTIFGLEDRQYIAATPVGMPHAPSFLVFTTCTKRQSSFCSRFESRPMCKSHEEIMQLRALIYPFFPRLATTRHNMPASPRGGSPGPEGNAPPGYDYVPSPKPLLPSHNPRYSYKSRSSYVFLSPVSSRPLANLVEIQAPKPRDNH